MDKPNQGSTSNLPKAAAPGQQTPPVSPAPAKAPEQGKDAAKNPQDKK